MPATSPPRAWAEIDLGAIRHNLNVVKQAAKGEYYMPVEALAPMATAWNRFAARWIREGIAFFGVANVGEARRISQAGCRTRPYILGPAFPEEREEIVLNGWRSFISTMEEAAHYNSLARLYGKTLPIHLSVDTGMGRGGFLPDQLEELLSRLGELDSLHLEGLGAHLPCADEDREITLRQISRFEQMAARIREKLPLKYCHLANSAASLDYEIPSNNMCRPGLVLYGFSPIPSPWAAQLKPAMALFSRLTVVRTLPEAPRHFLRGHLCDGPPHQGGDRRHRLCGWLPAFPGPQGRPRHGGRRFLPPSRARDDGSDHGGRQPGAARGTGHDRRNHGAAYPRDGTGGKGRHHFLGDFYRNRPPGTPPLHPLNQTGGKRAKPAAHFWGLLSRLTDRQKYRLVSQYDEGFHQRTLRAAPDD